VSGLVRPRIALLVLVITTAGYILERPTDFAALPWALVGTLLVAAAGCALNHFLERKTDALMARTAGRPLCTGALTERQVSWGGGLVMAIGFGILAWGAGRDATLWQALAIVTYLVVYTPLKKRTSVNTWVGALPGALPVIVGAAAAGGPSTLSWIVFLLVFLWQLPHFFAIASMYREDYMSGGLRMLSGDDPGDLLLRWQMPLQVMSVMLVSVIPVLVGAAGAQYGLAALAVGLVFLGAALAFRRRPDRPRARRVVLASVFYLPAVMAALIIDVACHDTSVVHVADGTPAHCEDCAVALVAGAADQVVADASQDEADDAEPSQPVFAALELESVDDGTGLPSHGALPEFSLISSAGRPFDKTDLLGSAWVVDFIFTHCSGPCPIMSQIFAGLQQEDLPTRYLSITVDPRRDGPRELVAYRAQHGGDVDAWELLTGEASEIQRLAEVGFRLPVNAGVEPVVGMPPMFHSGKFALVDREGRVRGYYDYRDRLSLEQMRTDLALLSDVTQ
jgi:protoheme IX farnesyltransferase